MNTTQTTSTFALINRTSGESWNYDSERQLKTVARLYGIQHPKASLAVTINGVTSVIR